MSFIKHKKVSSIPDGLNPALIQPSDWNEEHSIEPPVQGIIYDPDGDGNFSPLQGVGVLQDKVGDGVITHVRTQGLWYDAAGDGNISGLRVPGLLQDVGGAGVITGVNNPGVAIKFSAGTPHTSVAAAAENQYLRRKITGGPVEYEFGVIPPAAGFEPNVTGLLIDKLGNNVFSGVNVTGFPHNPLGDNNYVGVSAAAEGYVLRRKFGTATPSYEFADLHYVVSTDYHFDVNPQQALVAGVNTFTFGFFPQGINESSPNRHFLYLFDVAGSEIVSISAVNVATKTISFTTTLPHAAGAWSLSSASSGIQEAIYSAHGTGKGIHIYVPTGQHVIYRSVYAVNASSSPVMLVGGGNPGTSIFRGVGGETGSLFVYDPVSPCKFTIANMKIFNSQYVTLAYFANGGIAINVLGANFTGLDVEITNGNIGLQLTGANNVLLERVSFIQEAAYTALAQSTVGLFILGANNLNIYVNNCKFIGTDIAHANYLFAGIIIRGGNTISISNTTCSAGIAIFLDGGHGDVIANILINNCGLVFCKSTGLNIVNNNAPLGFGNIQISNCRIYGDNNGTIISYGITINSDVDYLTIQGNAIFGFGHYGILLTGGINNYEGIQRRSIIIIGNDIYGNNILNLSDGAGIKGSNSFVGLVITGNTCTNRSAVVGHQKYGIYFDDLNNSIIVGNKLNGNETDAAKITVIGVNMVINNNLGIDDVHGQVTSAATITLPLNPVVQINGSIPVSRMLGGWQERKVTILWSDPAPGGFVTGGANPGNFLTSYTASQWKTTNLINANLYWF